MAAMGQDAHASERVPRSLFVTNDFPPRVGGAQTYYWNMIQTLDPGEVVIVAPAHRDAAAFDATHPYTVIRTSRSAVVPAPSVERVCERLIRTHGLELLQLGHPLPAGLLGPWLRRKARVPYVVFLGGAEITVPGAVPGVARLLKRVLAESSLLFTVSQYTADQAVRLSGGRARAEVLRPALDIERYPLTGLDDAAAARAALGLDDAPLVLCGSPWWAAAVWPRGCAEKPPPPALPRAFICPARSWATSYVYGCRPPTSSPAPRGHGMAGSRSRVSASSMPRRRSPVCR